jgi:hypothetical protein
MESEHALIKIYPLSRAAFPGSESKFEVEVEGAEETTLDVRPCDEAADYEIHVSEVDGSSRTVTIKAPPDAENACLDFYVEAKDASGNIIAREHAEVMMGPKAMPPTFAITTLIGVVLVIIGMAFSSTISSLTLIGLGVFVTSAAIIASVVGIYGKNIGYPWHFTKEK